MMLDVAHTLALILEGPARGPKVRYPPNLRCGDEFYSAALGDLVFHADTRHLVSAFSLSTQASPGIIFKKVN